jgi:hypothetical protein
VRAKRQDKKLRLDCSQSLTPRERELLTLFRVMTKLDQLLLISMAKKMISFQAGPGGRTT